MLTQNRLFGNVCRKIRNNQTGGQISLKQSDRKQGIYCCECGGFGHVQVEYANALKKKQKAIKIAWSNHEGDMNGDECIGNVALTSFENDKSILRSHEPDESDYDEEEEITLRGAYTRIFTKWKLVCKERDASIDKDT